MNGQQRCPGRSWHVYANHATSGGWLLVCGLWHILAQPVDTHDTRATTGTVKHLDHQRCWWDQVWHSQVESTLTQVRQIRGGPKCGFWSIKKTAHLRKQFGYRFQFYLILLVSATLSSLNFSSNFLGFSMFWTVQYRHFSMFRGLRSHWFCVPVFREIRWACFFSEKSDEILTPRNRNRTKMWWRS